jgi:hypothetical protein
MASPLGFAVVVALTILRQLVRPLFIDFQNGLYTPTNAFLAGGDPYSEPYLAAAKVPFAYPPHALLTFLPFAALPYPIAAALYFAFGIASMLVIAMLSLRLAGIAGHGPWLWGTTIVLLLCRPGHMLIAQGQPTILVLAAALVVIGTLGSPWMMSWALAITTIKPTFGAPLLLLTLARGQTAIAVRALVIAGGLALYPVAVLAARAGGLLPFLTSFWTNYQHWLAGPDNGAATSIYRVDAAALLGHVVGQPLPSTVELVLSATLVLAAGLMLRHRARGPSHAPDHVETSLIVTTVLTAVYHQTYDLLLLARSAWRWSRTAIGRCRDSRSSAGRSSPCSRSRPGTTSPPTPRSRPSASDLRPRSRSRRGMRWRWWCSSSATWRSPGCRRRARSARGTSRGPRRAPGRFRSRGAAS